MTQTRPEGAAPHPSGNYAPYLPPGFNPARPGETPGVPPGAGPGPGHVAQPAPQGKDTVGKLSSKMKKKAAKGGEWAGKVSKYLSFGGSVANTLIGRTTFWFKLLAEGGKFCLFKTTFGAAANEELRKTYACHFNAPTGPVAGTLYVSNLKFAFCSDRALSYAVAPGQPSKSLYKVMLPLEKVKAVNPSTNKTKPDEHYIQVDMVDHHEFLFVAFITHEKAVKNMRKSLAKFRPEAYGARAGPPPRDAYFLGGSFNHPGPAPPGYPRSPGPPPPGYPRSPGPPEPQPLHGPSMGLRYGAAPRNPGPPEPLRGGGPRSPSNYGHR